VWEGRENCTRFRWESRKEKYLSEDQGVDGRMGQKWSLEIMVGGVEWNYLAQDRDRWQAFLNTVMNIRILAPRI
jgi:hypothetical protein